MTSWGRNSLLNLSLHKDYSDCLMDLLEIRISEMLIGHDKGIESSSSKSRASGSESFTVQSSSLRSVETIIRVIPIFGS